MSQSISENIEHKDFGGNTASLTEKPFKFHGKGGEYFKIWIVNFFLTLITLGIYSAWAYVRNKRYFYGNTELMGSNFEYHANPVSILKGRIIAVVLLLAVSALAYISPTLYLVMVVLIYVALPWVINRSLRFNAYNSSYRQIRFDFDGTYGKAAMAFIVWPILAVLTVFILLPLATKKQQEYIANHSLYGKTHFAQNLPIGRLYVITFMFLFITAIIAIPAYFLMLNVNLADAFMANGIDFSTANMLALIYAGMIAFYIGLIISYFYYIVALTNLVYNNLKLAGNAFKSTMTIASFAGLVIVNLLLLLVTLGLAMPWIKVRIANYAANKLAFMSDGKTDEFIQAETANVSALGEQIGDVFEMGI